MYQIFKFFYDCVSKLKLFKLKIQQLTLSQEIMWVMFYLNPQFYSFQHQVLTPPSLNQPEKVENQINIHSEQDRFAEKKENLHIESIKKSRKPNCHEEVIEDSSFHVPQANIIKATEQKLGRNSVSNIMRLFAKMLKSPVFKQIFIKVKQNYGLQLCLKEFNSWTNCIGLNSNKYIRIKKVLKGIRARPNFGRVLYCMFQAFVSGFARPAVLTSVKTESKNIVPTLNHIRKIKQELRQAVKEGCGSLKKNKKNVFD